MNGAEKGVREVAKDAKQIVVHSDIAKFLKTFNIPIGRQHGFHVQYIE